MVHGQNNVIELGIKKPSVNYKAQRELENHNRGVKNLPKFRVREKFSKKRKLQTSGHNQVIKISLKHQA